MSKRPTPTRLGYAITQLKRNVKEEDVPHLWALIYEIEGLQSEVIALERVVTKKQNVSIRVEKETEFSSWDNFPY
jgi:hypothetical protein